MKPLFAKPHLFISYSRKDGDLAEYLYRSLSAAGFTIYYDKEKTLVGENFVAEIVNQLRRSDAIVAVISRHSAESPWCQAELYHSHALEKMIAPLRLGAEEFHQAAPLDLMLKDINYVIVTDESSYAQATRQIQERLRSVRRKSYFRSLRNALLLALIAGLLVFVWKFGVQNLNAIATANQRRDLVERLKASNMVLTGDVIDKYAHQFMEDENLISELLLMESNAELSDTQRLNAHLLTTALLAPRSLRNRWYIKDVAWEKSAYESGELNNITFMKGNIRDVEFTDVTFSAVVWNPAPSQNSTGLMLSNLKFNRCQFNAGLFAGTGGVGLDFINCSFRGTQIEVSGFGAVHFRSQVSDPSSSIVTDEITVFENCSIANCVAPAGPGVIEIVPPDSEVRFTGVTFNGCHFRGLIRPSWFKDCRFMNCVFPKSVGLQAFERDENTIENCSSADEVCD